jgi:hypothetical protein
MSTAISPPIPRARRSRLKGAIYTRYRLCTTSPTVRDLRMQS